MQVTETLNEGLKHEFKINVPASDLDAKADAKLVDLKDKVRLNGFRPGKVPVAHLKKIYGRSVMAETIDQTIRDTNTQIFTERGFRLAAEPKVTMPTEAKEVEELLSGKSDLTYTVAIEVVPQIKLADFKGFSLEKPVAEITDTEINEAIQRIADANRGYAAKGEGAKAESGDRVTINFTGRINGEAFEGGTGEGIQVVIGTGQFIPGFEEQLVGIGAGETRTLKVSFPKNYMSEKLAGQPAEFETTATAIEAPQATEINDEFAKTLGAETLAKLRELVSGKLASEYLSVTRQKLKRQILDALDKSHDFTLPETLVASEFESIWRQVTQGLEQAGKTFADEGKSEDDMRAEYRTIAERRVRLGLVIGEIGDKAKVQVGQDELRRALIEQARRYPGQEKMVYEFYEKNPSALVELRAPIFEDKVVDHILEQAKPADKKVSVEELMKPDEDAEAHLHHGHDHDHDHGHDHAHGHDHTHDHSHDHDHDHGYDHGHDHGHHHDQDHGPPKK